MNYIGIDIGSTYTKYCVIDTEGTILELFTEQTPIQQREYFARKLEELHGYFSDFHLISCGYGRRNVEGQKTVNELTALAAGIALQCPDSTYILDIGGQDTKVICQQNGRLKEFFVNEKCAAGCGMFLKNTLEMLGKRFEEIDLSQQLDQPKIHLSSVCAVFAQTEIIEAIAADIPTEAIIRAVLRQILTQARTLLGKVEKGPITLSGGLTEISGIGVFAENILDRSVFVPQYARFLSAIGCAELCRLAEKGRKK